MIVKKTSKTKTKKSSKKKRKKLAGERNMIRYRKKTIDHLNHVETKDKKSENNNKNMSEMLFVADQTTKGEFVDVLRRIILIR